MTNADKEIYLRVLNRVSEMLAIIECADKQADEYPATLLRGLILRERNAVNVETDRAIREQAERNAGHQEVKERTSDD